MEDEFSGFVKPSEAAKMLGISTQRIRQLMGKGKLKFKETPFGRMPSRESVEAYDIARRAHTWAEPQKEIAQRQGRIQGKPNPPREAVV